jgi:hypothetical protein
VEVAWQTPATGGGGAHLVLLDEPRRLGALAVLLRRADHLQEDDPAYQFELRRWTDDRTARDDGHPPQPVLLRRPRSRRRMRTPPCAGGSAIWRKVRDILRKAAKYVAGETCW